MFLVVKEAGCVRYAEMYLFHLLVIWNNGAWWLALMRSWILSLVGCGLQRIHSNCSKDLSARLYGLMELWPLGFDVWTISEEWWLRYRKID